MGTTSGGTGRTATGSAAYGAGLGRDCTIAAARTALTAGSSGSVGQRSAANTGTRLSRTIGCATVGSVREPISVYRNGDIPDDVTR